MLPRTVSVEQHNIDAGVRRDSNACGIENAIQELIPSARFIVVDLQTIRFSIPRHDKRYVYLTPKLAQEFIIAFDRGEPLHPLQFLLGKPVRIQAMRHEWEGNLDTLAKIRENEKRRKSKKRRAVTRVRKYGIRMLAE